MYSSMWQKMHYNPAHQYPEITIYQSMVSYFIVHHSINCKTYSALKFLCSIKPLEEVQTQHGRYDQLIVAILINFSCISVIKECLKPSLLESLLRNSLFSLNNA